MRTFNPIREALKSKSAQQVYEDMKPRAYGAGLTAFEWDWFSRMEKQLEPAVAEQRRVEFKRQQDLEAAKRLSAQDLTAILSEKPHD